MSKTYKQQPKQEKKVRQSNAQYKRARREPIVPERNWKSALEWRLGKDD